MRGVSIFSLLHPHDFVIYMKSIRFLFLFAILLATGGYGFSDPTQLPEQLADALRAQTMRAGEIRIQAIAVTADGKGSALIRVPDGTVRAISKGDSFSLQAEGVSVSFSVRRIGMGGVELEAPSLPDGVLKLQVPYASGPDEAASSEGKEPAAGGAVKLAVLEVFDVPLRDVLRLLSGITGENTVVSPAAGEKPVRIHLRDIGQKEAIGLLCSSLGVWWRPDPATGIPTILTIEEYERGLASFREEETETFTLLYPNVIEVASVLYGLYPDRVFLTLGESDILEDEKNDLARRFERFKVIDDAMGSSSFDAGPSIRSVQVSGASGHSFSLNDSRRYRDLDADNDITYKGMTVNEARKLEEARSRGDEQAEQALLSAHRDRSPSIFVTVSRRNNLVIVRTGDSRAMADIRSLIRRLDVPTPTVLLEMRIMEFALTDDFESSFEYEFLTKNKSNGNTYEHTAGFPGFSPLSVAGRTDMFGYQLLSEHFNARIQLLEKDGKARTLATPTLLVANNEVSRLFIGEEVPITTGVTLEPISSTTSSGVTYVTGYTVEPSTSIRSIGTTLLVTPSINADHTVTLHLIQEESAVVPNGGSIPYGDAATLQKFSVDTVSSRRVSGTFIAADGLMSAVGGLIRERESESVSRVPVLGSIPLLGFLFRSTVREKERSELVIFIRPHIFSTPAEGEQTSKKLLESLSKNPDVTGAPVSRRQGGESPHSGEPPQASGEPSQAL